MADHTRPPPVTVAKLSRRRTGTLAVALGVYGERDADRRPLTSGARRAAAGSNGSSRSHRGVGPEDRYRARGKYTRTSGCVV